MSLVTLAMRRPLTVIVAVVAVVLVALLALRQMSREFSRLSASRRSMSRSRMAGWTRRRWRDTSPITTSITSSTSGHRARGIEHPGRFDHEAPVPSRHGHDAGDVGGGRRVNRSRAFMPPGTVPPFVTRFDAGSVPVGISSSRAKPHRRPRCRTGAQSRAAAFCDAPRRLGATSLWRQRSAPSS